MEFLRIKELRANTLKEFRSKKGMSQWRNSVSWGYTELWLLRRETLL